MLSTDAMPSRRHAGRANSEATSLKNKAAPGRSRTKVCSTIRSNRRVRHRASRRRISGWLVASRRSAARARSKPQSDRTRLSRDLGLVPPPQRPLEPAKPTRGDPSGQSGKPAVARIIKRRHEPAKPPSPGQPDDGLISRRSRVRTGDEHVVAGLARDISVSRSAAPRGAMTRTRIDAPKRLLSQRLAFNRP